MQALLATTMSFKRDVINKHNTITIYWSSLTMCFWVYLLDSETWDRAYFRLGHQPGLLTCNNKLDIYVIRPVLSKQKIIIIPDEFRYVFSAEWDLLLKCRYSGPVRLYRQFEGLFKIGRHRVLQVIPRAHGQETSH